MIKFELLTLHVLNTSSSNKRQIFFQTSVVVTKDYVVVRPNDDISLQLLPSICLTSVLLINYLNLLTPYAVVRRERRNSPSRNLG